MKIGSRDRCKSHGFEIAPTVGKTHLFLEEAGPECYLVLLHATRVSRAFRRHVVLPTTRPVFVILQVIRNELQPQTEKREKKERI